MSQVHWDRGNAQDNARIVAVSLSYTNILVIEMSANSKMIMYSGHNL